ncbi:MAG: AAA family ATPase [Thermoplasmata archaeon]|nr:AAA family ATPase [Thermoplasmata archaeon]
MAIKKIKIRNFRSFRDVEVELRDFNVVIGANASGKSNFVQIFKFLRDIAQSGLKNAISMQGGVEYLRNINIGADEEFSVQVVADYNLLLFLNTPDEHGIIMNIEEECIEFALKFKKRGNDFSVTKDKLILKGYFAKLKSDNENSPEAKKLGDGEIEVINTNGKIDMKIALPEGIEIIEDEILSSPKSFIEMGLSPQSLLLETPVFVTLRWIKIPGFSLNDLFCDFSIYDFDPKLPKKATPVTGKAELEEDGSNLSIVLKDIIESKKRREKLFTLLNDVLPFIDALGVEKQADRSLLFTLREKYSKKQFIPASLISDGTINITALILALYFEEKPLTIIEEPGRNLHPALIARVVEMMKDASRNKQIIVTTHNPEIVKNASLEDLLLASRDKNGFSTITRPADNTELKSFLENEIGIDELFTMNLLELK